MLEYHLLECHISQALPLSVAAAAAFGVASDMEVLEIKAMVIHLRIVTVKRIDMMKIRLIKVLISQRRDLLVMAGQAPCLFMYLFIYLFVLEKYS